jgi:hypothetical protein
MAALAAPVALAERAEIAVPAAPVAVALLDRAAPVVLALRAPAALVASVVSAAPAGMRVVFLMARLVGMPEQVAPVESAELRARLAPTRRGWLAALAARAGTRAQQVRERRVSAA